MATDDDYETANPQDDEKLNRYPYVDGVMYVAGATIWAYRGGDAKVVPWHRIPGRIEAGYFEPSSLTTEAPA